MKNYRPEVELFTQLGVLFSPLGFRRIQGCSLAHEVARIKHQYSIVAPDIVFYIYREASPELPGKEGRIPSLCIDKNSVQNSTEVCTQVFVRISTNSFHNVREIHMSL